VQRSPARDLDEALAEVDRPKSHLLVAPPAGLAARIYSSPTFHRLLPAPIAVRLAELRGTLEFRLLSFRRDDAIARAALLLDAETPDTPEVRRLARGLLQENAVQSELSWRPWLVPKARVEGLEHIERALAEGRPIVVGTLHLGSLLCLVQVLGYHGHRFYVSGGHRPGTPPWPGYLGRWVAAMNRNVERAGGRWVYRGGSYSVLRALLERGSICMVGQDILGDLPVPILGRRTRLVRGPLNLARETGAVYLPAFGSRRGSRHTVRFLDPIDTSLDDAAFGERLGAAIDGALEPRLPEAHDRITTILRRAGET
jgi:lauroyl/myristoyl acyltransferase